MSTPGATSVQFDNEPGGDYPADLYRFDQLAETIDGFDAITDEHLERYREQGYLAVRNAFSQAEVDAALEAILDLIDGRDPEFTGVQFEKGAKAVLAGLSRERKQDYVRKLMRFVDHDQRLRALAEHPRLLSVLERLVGRSDLDLFQDQALLKPPGGGREKPWHQDNAYFGLQLDTPIVGVWIALDEATPANGCMHVIPGSHRQGVQVHFRRRDWQICDTDVDTARDVVVPLPPGGCLLFDAMLHHGTPSNRTQGDRRRALQFHYTAADAIKLSREERLALFGSEGKNVTC